MTRREARAQQATGPQQTIWSGGSRAVDGTRPQPASGPIETVVDASAPAVVDAPSAPAVETPASPVADARTLASSAPGVPLTRAARRARTAPTPVYADAPAAEPVPAMGEQVVAVAALAAALTDAVAMPTPSTREAASDAVETASPSTEPAGDLAEEPGIPAAAIAWAAAAAAAVQPHPVVPVEPVLAPAEPFALLEPTVAAEPVGEASTGDSVDGATAENLDAAEPERESPRAERVADPEAAASDVDEFELAARLFAFTGETPVQSAKAAEADAGSAEATDQAEDAASVDEESTEPATHAVPRRRVRAVARQLTTASFSVGVMGIVGLLTVGMTTSADAVAAVDGTEPTSLLASNALGADVAEEDIQAYVAPDDIESLALDRDEGYAMVSIGELASEAGISHYSDLFVNDPNAAIQWPFSVGVPISSGFGPRWGRMHEGVDFVPGEGSEVQAIADGVVREATNSGGAYGVMVVIDHIIDGQLVSSRYGHMLVGSLRVSAGDVIKVGTVLGNTGNTGRSTGVHTHFEILLGGTTATDPIPWLRTYAGRDSLEHW